MTVRHGIAALVLLVIPAAGLACRCAQLPLAEYFAAADFVAMARLEASAETRAQRTLEFELLAAPHKGGTSAHGKGATIAVVTATSTATCGIQPDPGAVYVLFAREDDAGTLRVDSCSGTRVHLSTQLGEPVGFVDVPARFVAGQLNALFGLEVLADVSANAPDATSSINETLVGLLDLKALAHGGFMEIYANPAADAAVIGRVASYADVESREVGYEVSAAVVYAKLPGWYRIRRSSGSFGWLSAEAAGTWFPYASLPVRRLAYLTGEWSGLTWPGPGTGIPVRSELDSPRNEYPVTVHESVDIAGMPWFRVTVYKESPCNGGEPKPRATGWVPAYGRSGQPTTWYHSRGC